MKHIKSFNESNQDEEIYKRVSYDDYVVFKKSHKPIKITEKEKHIINNFGVPFESRMNVGFELYRYDKNYDYYIYKFDDDWWTVDVTDIVPDDDESVEIESIYFICDGMDGIKEIMENFK